MAKRVVIWLTALGGFISLGLFVVFGQLFKGKEVLSVNDRHIDIYWKLQKALMKPEYVLPVPPWTWEISAMYGEWRGSYAHRGLDIAVEWGSPVYSVGSGKVIYAGWDGVYGNMVKVDNGREVFLYAHLSKIRVKNGEKVETRDRIGDVGSTGYSTGPHLHLGLWVNGKLSDPLPWLKKNVSLYEWNKKH